MEDELKVGFRLDANEHVASGHMMRCAVIAKEMIGHGHTVIFFLAEEKNTEYLVAQGIEYQIIDGHWNNWDADTVKMIAAVQKEQVEILVVDSYIVTAGFLSALNNVVPVFLLDDICKTRYDVSAVLHYSEFPGENILKTLYADSGIRVFSGMQFVPLRPEFTESLKENKKQQIMITTGGTDPYHVSLRLIKLIADNVNFADWDILVVCGKMNEDYRKIAEMKSKMKNLSVLRNVSDMAELMQESKIAVSAGGTTIYELFCSGSAIVGFAFSDDQADFLKRFAQKGVLLYAGDVRKEETAVVRKIYDGVTELMKDETLREQFANRSGRITDGRGASRIAEKIIDVGRYEDE